MNANTTLNELFELIRKRVAKVHAQAAQARPLYRDFRAADIRHSHADISKAKTLLNYAPTTSLETGVKRFVEWYKQEQQRNSDNRRVTLGSGNLTPN